MRIPQLALCLAILTSFGQAGERPNVLVLLSDDQGWGDLGISGNPDLQTPHIDSLARQGASFSHFYVSPVCSPTRAEFLTGRHHVRSGVHSTSGGGERINADETTIADLLRESGYATGAFGKWHNGTQPPYHPNSRGFDEFYGFCSGHWGNYFDPMLEHNGRIVKGRGFCIDDFTERAMAFIGKAVEKRQPFFAYLPYNTPHSPMQVPDRFWQRFEKRELKSVSPRHQDRNLSNHTRCALAMCENLDWNVGRMLRQLDELGVADNTIVIWFHDNGPNGTRWNGGMKGIKGSTDEGGVRSPLFIRWPAVIAAGTRIEQISCARDLLPTLRELTGIAAQARKPLDGLSLKPLLLDPDTGAWPARILINQWGRRVSARSQHFRLDHRGQLYDMRSDPGQQTPVNRQHPQELAALSDAVSRHHRDIMAARTQDERPFPVGHPDSTLSQLPARDATAHGGIQRSSRHPNCSYFTNWKQTQDRITFDVEVLTTGRYRALLYHAARASGARCELRFKTARLGFHVPAAHDLAEHGAERDRHPRSESYVKDFKALPIGVIELEKGRGELSLQAIEIPGSEVMEFRLLTLERLEPDEGGKKRPD